MQAEPNLNDNLRDIRRRYVDVVNLATVQAYLEGIRGRNLAWSEAAL